MKGIRTRPDRPAAAIAPEGVPGRDHWMDAVRGAAIILMLVLHATNIPVLYAGTESSAGFTAFNNAFGPFRMPMLMFLSGMLLERSLRKPAGRYLTGKLRVLLWSYLVWAAVLFTVLGEPGTFLAPHTWVQTIYLWYLSFLLVYYVVALVVARHPVLLWGSVLGSFAAHAIFSALERGFLSNLFFYYVFFALGYAAVRHRWRRAFEPLPGVMALVAVAVALQVVNRGLAADLRDEVVLVIDVLAVLAVVMAVARLGRMVADRGPVPLLSAVGRDSLVYYCVHFPVMVLVSRMTAAADLPLTGVILACLCAALLAGTGLVALRRRVPAVGWLFEFAPSRRRSLRTPPTTAVPSAAPVTPGGPQQEEER